MGIFKRGFQFIKKGLKWLLVLVILSMAISALYNLTLSDSSTVTEKLSAPQKAYLAEYFHLQEEVIRDIWPSFSEEMIPVIVYNEEYAFLIGMDNPDSGWMKMPYGEQRGHAWEVAENDNFKGQRYYRQPIPDPAVTPENFTVKVGTEWVSTMQTREFAEVSFYNGFKNELPLVINWVFPYKIFWNLMMGEAESYTIGLIHEALHGFQGRTANEKFSEAEFITRRSGGYPWELEENRSGWENEAECLMGAYKAEEDSDALRQITQFINARDERRRVADLTKEFIEYEKKKGVAGRSG